MRGETNMPQETSYPKLNIVDANGNILTFSGGGGDASADNQQSQILLETAIRDRLPSALVGGRLPVDVQSLSVTVNNAQLEIANEVGNPVPTTISGLERPSITIVSGTINTSGDNTIVAAPGVGLSINLCYIKIQLEATTATTVLLKSGSTTKERILCQNQGEGLANPYFPNRELRLDANTALVLSLSGANSINYAFHYFTS